MALALALASKTHGLGLGLGLEPAGLEPIPADKPGNACQRVKGTDRQLKSDTLIYNTGFCCATERSQASYDFISRSLIRHHGRDRGGGRRD